jgi:hypothetical protein
MTAIYNLVQNYSMKKIFTFLSLILLTYFNQVQATISYTVTTSGNCFPITVTINISSDDPTVNFFRVNKDYLNGGWNYGHEVIVAGNPYSFVTNNNINAILGIQALNSTGILEELFENYAVSGNQYTLSTQTSLPYSVSVGQAFPIQLITSDSNITSVSWDFGNGQS